MKSIFVLPLASIALFALSAAAVKQGCCYGMNPAKFNSVPLCKKPSYIRPPLTTLEVEEYYRRLDVSDLEKKYEWDCFFEHQKDKIEKYLSAQMDHAVQKMEKDWDEWMRKTENKWMHFNPDMQKEYNCSVYPEALKWGVTKWISWFHEKGLSCLKKDFQKYIASARKAYRDYMLSCVLEMNKSYAKEFCSRPWKLYDDYVCKKWEKRGSRDSPFYVIMRLQWCQWANRNRREKEQWKNLMQEMAKKYVNVLNCPDYRDWKKDKTDFYKEWLRTFTKAWITDEQWTKWTEERKQYILTKKPDTQKSAGKKPAAKKTTTKKPATKKTTTQKKNVKT
ncbi:hypothetical protein PVMG_05446 [Plasmodium vivax Mauritania I]|uniref:Tryptophan/threonine-rich plasmodium antigen C-terminal domain-containing protein n=1 Tax=Plasmodium vivax Mauritania I TaxID=1035515 RepID=A0A0J9TCY0_PLAVI|nr:hypothetical protein PVMG_05446 [Plasmodium vivax Mauritania I]